MPCVARESTSLIIFELAWVSSSSSFTRSRIGWVWRCTYFLRANGLTLPQKPWRLSYCKGAFPVALSPELLDGVDAVCDDWSLGVELAGCCWASAGRESKHATNNATIGRFIIFNILRVHVLWGSRRPGRSGCAQLNSSLHAIRGRDRDI